MERRLTVLFPFCRAVCSSFGPSRGWAQHIFEAMICQFLGPKYGLQIMCTSCRPLPRLAVSGQFCLGIDFLSHSWRKKKYKKNFSQSFSEWKTYFAVVLGKFFENIKHNNLCTTGCPMRNLLLTSFVTESFTRRLHRVKRISSSVPMFDSRLSNKECLIRILLVLCLCRNSFTVVYIFYGFVYHKFEWIFVHNFVLRITNKTDRRNEHKFFCHSSDDLRISVIWNFCVGLLNDGLTL